eukprot:scpid69205/ scgid15447/ Replication-associated protein; ATP-dependent helicase Rep; RepP
MRFTLCIGPSGCGKTRYCMARTGRQPHLVFHYSGSDRGWLDGYLGQPCALFDDFDGSELNARKLLRMLDRNELRVPVKGGLVNWNYRDLFVTSTLDPDDWYRHDVRGDRTIGEQMMRRVTHLRDFTVTPWGLMDDHIVPDAHIAALYFFTPSCTLYVLFVCLFGFI